jgi:hypothetical protein
MTAVPKRRWRLYALITLLVLVVVAGIAITLIGRTMRAWMRRTEEVEAIANAGGRVRFDFQIDESGNRVAKARVHGSAWLRPLMGGDDLGSNAVEAEVPTDDALKVIECLNNLRSLELTSSGITDACLPYLEHLVQLRSLHFHRTKVSEEGVTRLQEKLPNCKIVRESGARE